MKLTSMTPHAVRKTTSHHEIKLYPQIRQVIGGYAYTWKIDHDEYTLWMSENEFSKILKWWEHQIKKHKLKQDQEQK